MTSRTEAAGVTVREARDRRDLRAFIHLPWRIYRGDPNWVPPLLREMWETLTAPDNALLKAGPHAALVARRGGEPVGRVLCGINEQLRKTKGQRHGYFSLFESVDDMEVARALMGAAEECLRARGAEAARGPVSPTQGDDYRGLLVEGFGEPPVLMDSYSPEYYRRLLEDLGYRKQADLLAFRYDKDHVPERLLKVSEYAMRRYGFTVRGLRMAALEDDLRDIKRVLDRAMPEEWEDLAPPGMDDITAMARRLRPLADPELCAIAHAQGGTGSEPIGFIIGLPNYNEVLIRMNGRLFPFGWLRFLLGRRRITGIRMFILFVVPEWRKKAVTGAMFAHVIRTGLARGYTWAEGSTVGETNTPMVREAEGAGGVRSRVYRVYEKTLRPPAGR